MAYKKIILQICPRLSTGGIERGTIDVAIALQQAGFHPIVVSGGGKLEHELAAANVQHIQLPVHEKLPWKIYKNARLLADLINKLKPDLVHARSRAPIWTSYLACKQTQTPLITSCHSPHSGGFFGLKHVYNRAVSFGNTVIATSEFIKDYLINDLKTPRHKIQVIYRGINLDQFNPASLSEQAITQAKKQLGIPSNKRLICLAGRITRWKGQDLLVDALHQLQDPSLHAIIVGRVDSQPYYNELKDLIAQYGLNNQVTLISESQELPILYAMSEIALSTSRKPEAFGRVAVEAQAMGCLTIASNLGAAKETVLDGVTGFLIKPDCSNALATKIASIQRLSDAEKLAIAQTARRHTENNFSKKAMMKKTLAIYKQQGYLHGT